MKGFSSSRRRIIANIKIQRTGALKKTSVSPVLPAADLERWADTRNTHPQPMVQILDFMDCLSH